MIRPIRAALFTVLAILSFWLGSRSSMTHRVVPPLWQRDRIIDIHGHIGTFQGFDLTTGTLLKNIRNYGIGMVLVSNIDGADLLGQTANLDESNANRATLDMVVQHPEQLHGILWARPEDGSASNLEPFLRDHPRTFVGVKFHPIMNHFAADDPRVDQYLDLCDRYSVPAVFHCDKPGTDGSPQRIYAVAKRHPNVPIILYHMVFYGPHEEGIAVVRESLRKKDAQLYLETAQAKSDDVIKAVKELGADRVLFGSDAPYFGEGHYSKYERQVSRLRSELSPEDFAKVVRGNAVKLFRLK